MADCIARVGYQPDYPVQTCPGPNTYNTATDPAGQGKEGEAGIIKNVSISDPGQLFAAQLFCFWRFR